MTNVQLKVALNTLLTKDTTSQQINNILLEEVRELRKQVADFLASSKNYETKPGGWMTHDHLKSAAISQDNGWQGTTTEFGNYGATRRC